MQRLRDEYAGRGKREAFAVLEPALVWNGKAMSYEAMAAKLGLNATAVAQAVKRMRGRFRALLDAEIAEHGGRARRGGGGAAALDSGAVWSMSRHISAANRVECWNPLAFSSPVTSCPVCQNAYDSSQTLGGLCRRCLMMGGVDDDSADPSPPSAWSPPEVEELHELLSDYEVIELIGRGGMGAVYKARQPTLDRLVAIKVLPVIRDELGVDFVARFRNEARLMARMNSPGIVHVYDFGELPGGMCFFVMEFVGRHGRGTHGQGEWQAAA